MYEKIVHVKSSYIFVFLQNYYTELPASSKSTLISTRLSS